MPRKKKPEKRITLDELVRAVEAQLTPKEREVMHSRFFQEPIVHEDKDGMLRPDEDPEEP